jgi:hypothetical protein
VAVCQARRLLRIYSCQSILGLTPPYLYNRVFAKLLQR